ncbi:hypothetical protein BCR33DRAFT_189387 [Rhizoclosmatium globosum]|uniref:Ankyrin n=1 Tax=Rhizoclosmatium globosum TaxID=329046 RepID=A0A1Y2D3M8_9FUNG|nr:hypothetical protein BCR33DRAFT_189387 [Rhizoclosmatium globosum]|eukprot:ORY53165.1 hypothetical protein BCR33DRAFT_189387 [Rhizoclosmatium globosum]
MWPTSLFLKPKMAPSYPPPHCQTTDLESGLQDESAVNPGGTTPPESATLNGSNDSVHTNNANPEISYRDIPIYREVLRDNADGVKSILKSTQSTNFTEIQRRGKLGETILHVAILNCKTKVAAMLINDYGDEQVVLQEAPNVGGRTESTRLIDVCYGVGKTRELFYEPSSQIPVSVPWGVIDNYFDDSTIHESQQEPKVQETENSSSQRLETESVGSMSTHYVLKTEKKAIYKLEEKKAIIPPKLLEPVSCLKCYLGETALHLACKNRMTEIVS